MKALARVIVLAALLAVFWCVIRWAPVAAQGSADARLRELVAKVTMNEGGPADDLDADTLADDPDGAPRYASAALIWQVVEARGATSAERARWLEHHSPCVSGRLSQDAAAARSLRSGGSCVWSRNLRADGRIPRGWPYSQQTWHRMRPRWAEHLVRVRALVDGEDTYRPCPVAPETWDGARWQARAEARGWTRVECEGGAANAGYVRTVTTGGAS